MALSSSRKHTLLVGALLVGTVVLLAVPIWRHRTQFLARWHLRELRENPEGFEANLVADDPARRRAAGFFVAEPAGREALFRLYLAEFERTTPRMGIVDFLPRRRQQGIVGGWLALSAKGHYVHAAGPSDKGSGSSLRFKPEDPVRRERVLEFLSYCGESVFTHEQFPGFEFVFRPIRDGLVEPPPWESISAGAESPPPRRAPSVKGASHICFFRVSGR